MGEEGKWQWVVNMNCSDQGFKAPFDFFSSPTSFLLPPILIPRPNAVTRILYHHASDNLNNTKTPEVYLCYGKSGCVSTKKTRREIIDTYTWMTNRIKNIGNDTTQICPMTSNVVFC